MKTTMDRPRVCVIGLMIGGESRNYVRWEERGIGVGGGVG